MMKKFYLFVLASVILASCNKTPETEPELKLTVDPTVITCPDLGGDYTVSLNAPVAWSAQSDASWVKVTPTSGAAGTAEVQIKITANKESSETKGKVTFTSGEETLELYITRAAKAPASLKITSEKEINTPKDGGTYTVMVESNIRWSISSNAGWAKVSKGVSQNNDNITITVDAATTPEETTATITVAPYGEGKEAGEQTLTITRGGTDATSLSVDMTSIDAPADGGTYNVKVESNARWRVTKDWDADWITIFGTTESENDGTFGITVEAATSVDPATAIITVEEIRSDYYKPVIVQVTVNRKGKAAASLSVSPLKINAPAEGGTYAVIIKSNYPWKATGIGTKYFSMSMTSGEGDATMNVTVKPSTEEEVATGSITIATTFGGEKAKINIRREAYVKPAQTLKVYPVNISTTSDGGKYTINVTGNCAWTASSSDLKVASMSPTSGTAPCTFEVIVSPTSLTTASTAVISVTSEDGTVVEKINISRAGRELTKLARKPFTVGKSKKVYFSPGNLQYYMSTDKFWFAEYQYEYYGLAAGISDLFGWGSGKDPMKTDYSTVDDIFSFYDWGLNNPIYYQEVMYPKAYGWRTMTEDEWEYLLSSRSNAKNLCGVATVNSVKGYVLLPDDWSTSYGFAFTSNTNYDYATNTYTKEVWRQMESKGAVFLPAGGYRFKQALGDDFGQEGYYWTSTIEQKQVSSTEWEVYHISFRFNPYQAGMSTEHNCAFGHSVRLVEDAK